MLVCKRRYRAGIISYDPGNLINDPPLEAWLLRDSPDSFAVHQAKAAEIVIKPIETEEIKPVTDVVTKPMFRGRPPKPKTR